MSQRGPVGIPYFGNPPSEYDQRYFSDLVRAFAQFTAQMTNPGELRGTKIVLTDLPVGDQGLEPGTLYRDGSNVRVSDMGIAAVHEDAMTISDGTVTVLTP